MKKLIMVLMTLIMVTMFTISAYASLYDEVYSWKKEIDPDFQIFNGLKDGEYIVKNGIYYSWSSGTCLIDELAGMEIHEIEKWIETTYREHGAKHAHAEVYQAGPDIYQVEVGALSDLRELHIFSEEIDEPVYYLEILCWSDYQHMR